MATFNHLMVPLYNLLFFIFMRITDYFTQRNSKVIDDEITPLCSPHHSESLESTIAIPDSQPALIKQDSRGQQGQFVPILVTNSTNRAGRHRCGGEGEKEEQEKNKTKLPQAPKKESQHLPEIAHTLLITPMRLIKRFQPEGLLTIPLKMYLQTT